MILVNIIKTETHCFLWLPSLCLFVIIHLSGYRAHHSSLPTLYVTLSFWLGNLSLVNLLFFHSFSCLSCISPCVRIFPSLMETLSLCNMNIQYKFNTCSPSLPFMSLCLSIIYESLCYLYAYISREYVHVLKLNCEQEPIYM